MRVYGVFARKKKNVQCSHQSKSMRNEESKDKDVKINKQEKERAVLEGQCLLVGRLAGWLAGKLVWFGGLWFLVQL